MVKNRVIIGFGVMVSLMTSSVAFAGEVTRSASVLPSVQASKTSVFVRRSIALKKKSNLEGGATSGVGTDGIIVGTIAGGLVGLGIYEAVKDNKSGG